jgi:hypothetical protein
MRLMCEPSLSFFLSIYLSMYLFIVNNLSFYWNPNKPFFFVYPFRL